MKRLTVIILLVLAAVPVLAQDVSRQKERKKQIEQEIALIDKQLDANTSKRKKSLNTLILTRRKLEARKKLIAQLDKDIAGYDRDIAGTNAQIDRLNARLDTLRKYHADLIRRQARQIKDTEYDLRIETARLEGLKAESVAAKAEREREKDRLAAEEKKMNSMVVQLTKNEKTLKKELKQKQKEVERLNREIERILAEAVRQQKAGEGEKVDYALSAKFGDNKGKLPWPVQNGVVIQKFGQTYHPVFKNLKMPYNNGINISAPAGSNATAVFDGVVKQVLVMPGYDQCVLVQHGEYFTFYCKLRQVYVKSGDRLSTGDRIGQISTNEDGNAELHFQLWKGTDKQNPETWLR